MFGRSSFGVSQPSTFGFGSGASTSFGQPNQLFGSSNSTFGTGSSGFGSASQPIFGNPQQNTAPLFGSSTTPAFGQTNQSSGFGSSLFGNAQQPSGSSGIFGSSASTSFGQQNKPTGFGFPSSSSGGLFGQTTQPPQNAGSMFQGPSSSALFGNSSTFGSGQGQTGTLSKFVPVTGTDSQQKSGVVQSINTKHFCITCMKEYENKSLEELRWEDYQANRKGQQQSSFGGPTQPFGIASTNSTLFGQTENKPVFGQTSTAFGQSNFGMPSQTTASNMFGKSSSAFGNTSTTNSFAFGGTPTTSIFGTNMAPKPFAATPNQPLFGSTQHQQSNFGTNIFGQPITSTTSNLFAKPTQQGFNMGQNTFQFGTQPQITTLFQNQKPNTGFNIFGQTNTTNSAFGPTQQQSSFTPFNNFAKPNQSNFAQMVAPPFMGMLNSSALYNSGTKSMFTPSNNLFINNFQPSTGFNMQSQQPQQQTMTNMQTGNENQLPEARPFIQPGDPYGYNPHLNGLLPMKQEGITYTTNPKELQKYLETPQPIAVVTPITKRIKVFPPTGKKSNLFDDSIDLKTSEINLTLKSSSKRLIIKRDLNSSLHREESDTSLDTNADIEVKSTPSLMSIASMGPPILSPIRLKQQTMLDDYSCSGIATSESITNLLTEKSDKITTNPQGDSVSASTIDVLAEEAKMMGSGDTHETINTLIEPQIDTCGITLTRPDYYTVPPLEKLIEHRLGDGQCLIRGFTIGRAGYGNVSFPELINVANLNLDELVHFRYRELTIYPDDSKKPPQGQGLNRRAQVTLDRVYPKGKGDRRLITNAQTLTAINFADTLKELCDKHGTKFLDYRPESGSWVFLVEHFSKYKYADSEEDDDSDELDAQTKGKVKPLDVQLEIDNEARSVKVQFLGDVQKEIIEAPIHELIIDDDDDSIAYSPKLTESVTSEPCEILDADVLAMGDYSTRLTSSSLLHQVKTRRELYQDCGDKLFLMKAALFEEDDYVPVNIEEVDIETIGKTRRLLRDFAKSSVLSKDDADIDRRRSRRYLLRNKPCTLSLNKSIYNCRNYMDMALFKSRSFKVGWGKGLTMVTGGPAFQNVSQPAMTSRIQIIDVSKLTKYDALLQSLPGHLRIILETSDVQLVDGIPFAKVKNSNAALACHQHLAKQAYLRDSNNRPLRYYKEIWDLLVALWSEIPRDVSRREELSNWFQQVLTKEVDEILREFRGVTTDMIFKEIFVYLTGNQLYEAAELAIRNGIPNLALLISQLNLSPETKSVLQCQMEQWKSSMTLDFIPITVQKIYMLLSGMLIYEYDSRQFKKTVNVCEYLNWRQCLAIILWYMTSSSDSISTSLQIYKEAYNKHYICVKPTPEHLDNSINILDIQYYLLLLHCNKSVSLEKVLHPLTHTTCGSDYRLSWLLLQMLTALGVGVLNEERRVAMSTSFSIQLVSLGLSKWAVFPLLFINDPVVRKNQIMRTLHQNLDSILTDLSENQLVKELLIPPQWIHEIQSYKTGLLNMHWQNYQHLAYTKLWYEAHKIAIEHIIPDLIINEKFDIINSILRNLMKGHKYIRDWNGQGGLLVNFLNIARECNRTNMPKNEALKTHSALLEIINKLPFYPMATPKQIAAVSELSKRCVLIAKILLHIIQPTYRGLITVTTFELDRLIMPTDYIFQDFQCMILNV